MDSFTDEEWRLILHSMRSYVILQEYHLSKLNVGDKPWQELEDINKLVNIISMDILKGE
jgi:hypothetical protein